MALTIIGRTLSPPRINANKTGTYTSGSSTITCTSHGMSTGWSCFVDNSEAMGFWYVVRLTANTFTIRRYTNSSDYVFKGTGSLSFNGSNVQVFNAASIHLPIVYNIQSDLWPINTVDTVRTVSSYSNDNGYAKITASGVIKSDITELEFVKVTFTGGATGIYQVLSWYSNSIVTINLPYVGGLTFVSIQYYYNNYRAKIKVITFRSGEGQTTVGELNVVPDSTGMITVSINDILKQSINILKNDLNQGTLPVNNDAFIQFWIKYAEAYDYSTGGYTLLDYVGPYTEDLIPYTGYAVNAKMPFKDLNYGQIGDYILSTSYQKAKFLTPSLYPELYPGKYFDISFFSFETPLRVNYERYLNGVIIESTFVALTAPVSQIGVLRIPITQTLNEDRIDVSIWETFSILTEKKTITVNNDCYRNAVNLTWLNYLGGFDYQVFTANADFGTTIQDTTTADTNIFENWPNSYGASADTLTFETSRTSRQNITLRIENITEERISDLFRIKTSPLVQIINSVSDRRTVIVDTGSFVWLQQGEKQFNLTFNVSYTDENPSQSL